MNQSSCTSRITVSGNVVSGHESELCTKCVRNLLRVHKSNVINNLGLLFYLNHEAVPLFQRNPQHGVIKLAKGNFFAKKPCLRGVRHVDKCDTNWEFFLDYNNDNFADDC